MFGQKDARVNSLTDALLQKRPWSSGDPHRQNNLMLESPDAWYVGYVIYSIPYYGWYRVQLSGALGVLDCTAMTDCTGTIGPHKLHTIKPHTAVLVFKQANVRHGIIVGSVPLINSNNVNYSPGLLTPGITKGVLADAIYDDMINGTLNVIQNYAGYFPLDNNTFVKGNSSSTGVKRFDTPFMLADYVSTLNGRFRTLQDDFYREISRNCDDTSGASTRYVRQDGTIVYDEQYYSISLKEWMGCSAGTLQREVMDSRLTQRGFPGHEVDLPSAARDTVPVPRRVVYNGQLGGIYTEDVVLPAKTGMRKLSDPCQDQCVYRYHVGLDGSTLIQTARSHFVHKHFSIPAVKRIRAAEDSSGDTPTATPWSASPVDSPLVTVQNVSDYLARQGNWSSVQPFKYLSKDFHVKPNVVESAKLPLSEVLQHKQILQHDSVDVDVGNGTERFYKNSAFYGITADGSIVFQSAGGAALILGANGQISLSCPGLLHISSGSDVILNGKNIVGTAARSVDIVATGGDLRIFSANNMQARAGSVLVEATNPEALDVSAHGEAALAHGISFRSATDINAKSVNFSVLADTAVVDITNQLHVSGDAVHVRGKSVAGLLVGSGARPGAYFMLTELKTFLSNELQVNALQVTEGDLHVKRDILAAGNAKVAGRVACTGGGEMDLLEDGDKNAIDQDFISFNTEISENRTEVQTEFSADLATELLNAIGAGVYSFSFRDGQYELDYAKMACPAWLGMMDSEPEPLEVGSVSWNGRTLRAWPGNVQDLFVDYISTLVEDGKPKDLTSGDHAFTEQAVTASKAMATI